MLQKGMGFVVQYKCIKPHSVLQNNMLFEDTSNLRYTTNFIHTFVNVTGHENGDILQLTISNKTVIK